jgi:hypothetical protein
MFVDKHECIVAERLEVAGCVRLQREGRDEQASASEAVTEHLPGEIVRVCW